MSQPLSEEQALSILQQIVDKNNAKKAIADRIIGMLNDLAAVCAEIGELTAQLKPVEA